MSDIHEHEIFKFLANHKVVKISDVFDAFGQDGKTRNDVKEKLMMMARFGIVFINDEFVSTSKILDKKTEHDKKSEKRAKLQGKMPKPIMVEALNHTRILKKETRITNDTLEPIIKNAKTILHEVK